MSPIYQLYTFFYIFFITLFSVFLLLIIRLISKKDKKSPISEYPSVNLYVPCKSHSENLEKNIYSILAQDYPDLFIYFIVGSKKDPAYQTLKKLVNQHTILIAGDSEKCSQKNHNLLFGIAKSRKSDIYSFFDADIHFKQNSVSLLVGEILNRKNTIATSFPKKDTANLNLAETIFHFYYSLQYVLCFNFKAVWGGFFALRRKDFEKLNIQGIWSRTAVDDVPLTKQAIEKKIIVAFIKQAEIYDTNIHKNISDAFFWTQRQTLFIKHYLWPYWVYSIIFIASMIISAFGLISATLMGFEPYKAILDITAFLVVFFTLHSLNRIFTKKAGIMKDFVYFIPALAVIFFSLLSTLIANDINWGGRRYRVSNGRVCGWSRL